MPSGKTHDGLTLILAIPTFAAGYEVSRSIPISVVLAVFFIFGGLMFGPDLDTRSKQYSRWWIFSWLWFPYRIFFAHRSRWTHGLVFGTFIRAVYFTGVLTLGGSLAAYLFELVSGARLAGAIDFFRAWQNLAVAFNAHIGQSYAAAVFLGLWLGAAAHTFTDIAGTYIKTGRVQRFL